jgi:outer membrane protein assembly factor BamB
MPTRIALLIALLGTPYTVAADWPQWRGPKGDGTTSETNFPTRWSATENVRWKAAIPGVGHSSPVVSKGKVFVTSCVTSEKKRMLYCLDRATGKVLWERVVVVAPLERKHKLNSYASATPAADGERVFVTFLDYPHLRVYCYDYAGNKLWEKSPGEFHSVHGFCSPPVLYKDAVIINGDQDAKGPLRAYIVALDRKTGAERWRIDRPNRIRSYCPPVFITVNGRPQMVLTGALTVAGYDPDTGEQLWLVNGPTEQFVSSMVYHEGVAFLTAGFPKFWVMAIDPTGHGNVTKTHVRWSKQTTDGGYVPSPVAHGGRFFVVNDNGLASCWDAKSGKELWKERLGGHQSGSGVVAGGKVYFTDDNGETFVLRAGPEFDLIARNPIGERCFSSPAFSDGAIFIRGEKHLFCIGGKK